MPDKEPIGLQVDSLQSVYDVDLWALLGHWRNGHGPLWARLADAIEQAVLREEIAPKTRLPSERILADRLGIARSTVVRALGALSERGLLERVRGSGTIVRDLPPTQQRTPSRIGPWPLSEYYRIDAPVPLGLGSAVVPHPSSLPAELLTITADDLVADGDSATGYIVPGLPTTRTAIATMLHEFGIPATPDSIIVTSGATQSTALLIEYLLRHDDAVIVDRRAYPTTLALLRRAGVRIIIAPETVDGYTDPVAVHRLAIQHQAAMVFLMTACNAATGASIPDDRHAPLLDLAGRGVTVVDDRALADYLPHPGPKPLGAQLQHPNLITIGSLNKVYWGGLRIGWLHAHESLIHPLVRMKAASDSGTSVPSQVLANRLLGQHARIAADRRHTADRARAAAMEIVRAELPDWRVEGHPVGPTMWIRLPVNDTADFVAFAFARDVVIGYGGNYRSDGRPSQHIRVSLTNGENATRAQLYNLADVWRSHQRAGI